MNHKQYLLDLLDGSASLSHEGIGMVVARLERLEAVVEAANKFVTVRETGRYAHHEYNEIIRALKAPEGEG